MRSSRLEFHPPMLVSIIMTVVTPPPPPDDRYNDNTTYPCLLICLMHIEDLGCVIDVPSIIQIITIDIVMSPSSEYIILM